MNTSQAYGMRTLHSQSASYVGMTARCHHLPSLFHTGTQVLPGLPRGEMHYAGALFPPQKPFWQFAFRRPTEPPSTTTSQPQTTAPAMVQTCTSPLCAALRLSSSTRKRVLFEGKQLRPSPPGQMRNLVAVHWRSAFRGPPLSEPGWPVDSVCPPTTAHGHSADSLRSCASIFEAIGW